MRLKRPALALIPASVPCSPGRPLGTVPGARARAVGEGALPTPTPRSDSGQPACGGDTQLGDLGQAINHFQCVHRVAFKPCGGVCGELDSRMQEALSSPFIFFRIWLRPCKDCSLPGGAGGLARAGPGLGCVQVKIASPTRQGAGNHAPCSWSSVLMKFRRIIFNQCHAQEEKEPLCTFIDSHRKKTLRRPFLGIPAHPSPPPLTCTERSPGPGGDNLTFMPTLSHPLLPFPAGKALGIWPCLSIAPSHQAPLASPSPRLLPA